MNKTAFSLIELLVVITIIGVLVAIAVPQYKKYVITSKLERVAKVVESYMEQSITYSALHGRFAYAADFNLNNGTTGIWDVPDSLNPFPYYLSNSNGGFVQFEDSSQGYGNIFNPCGKFGYILVYLDATKLGFDSSVATNPNVWLECDFYHAASGVINKYCSYGYGTNAASQTNSILPGWHNANTTTGYDFNNWNNFVTNALATGTCQ